MGNINDCDISHPKNSKEEAIFLAGSSRTDYITIRGFAVIGAITFDKNFKKLTTKNFKEPGDIIAHTISRVKNPEHIQGAGESTNVLLVGCARNIHCVHYHGGEFIHLVKLIDVFGKSKSAISCISNLGSTAICVSDDLGYFVSMDLSSLDGNGIVIGEEVEVEENKEE